MDVSGFWILRTPVLPFEIAEMLGQGLEAPRAAIGELEAALARDRATVQQRLRDCLADPLVREGLFVASRSLWQLLEEPRKPLKPGAWESLLRYLYRMATRTVPFGLFASVSPGSFAESTVVVLGPISAAKKHACLDMQILDRIIHQVWANRGWREAQRFRFRPDLYQVGDRIRYLERTLTVDFHRRYHLVSVELDDILERIAAGAASFRSFEEVVAVVFEAAGGPAEIDLPAVGDYVHALIDQQILIPETDLAVTGPPPIRHLMQALNGAETSSLHECLAAIADLYDSSMLGPETSDLGPYLRIENRLREAGIEADPSRTHHLDFIRPAAQATLGPEVVAEIQRGVGVLWRLRRKERKTVAEELARRFEERYGIEEWVPLLEALDEENGLSVGSADGPLPRGLDGIDLAARPKANLAWDPVDQLAAKLLGRSRELSSREVELTEEDLAEISPALSAAELPISFAALCSLGRSAEDGAAGTQPEILLSGVVGPSGANLIGRFCHADAEIRHLVEQHLRGEEALAPETVFAEIAHLPEGRHGNIISRPALRAHEIPILCNGSVHAEHEIPLADLWMTVDKNGQIVLRSKRLRQRVVPRMTTAHNFSASKLKVYRVLCALQANGSASWSWGPLADVPFLPRVRFGSLVFSRCQWNLEGRWLASLRQLGDSERWLAVARLRRARGIPRWVFSEVDSREILVDFESVASIDAWLAAVQGESMARLIELFPGPEGICVRGPEGRFCHEMLIPFLNPQARLPGAPPQFSPREETRAGNRRFLPGSEWLSAKLYASHQGVDRLLRELVGPLVSALTASGAIQSWFFIRFADPDWHLRLRLRGDRGRLAAEALPLLNSFAESFSARGVLQRLEIDTYRREIERYGGFDAIEIVEEMFHADSAAVASMVGSGIDDAERWKVALVGGAQLLAELVPQPESRQGSLQRLQQSFAREHGVDARLRRQLSAALRSHRRELLGVLCGEDAGPPWPAMRRELRLRSAALEPHAERLGRLASQGRLCRPVSEIAESLIHMFCNRLLASQARAQEMIIYDFLLQLQPSLAILRKMPNSAGSAQR